MLINTSSLSSISTGYSAAFKAGFSKAPPKWSQVATLVPSINATNLYAYLGQFPQLREWLGDRVIKNMKAEGYTLTNKDFESTIGVPRNTIEDDTFGIFTPMFEQMGYAAAMHPDSGVFAALAAGASSLCYDGQYFFDTDHQVAGSNKDNYDATGGGNLWALLDTRMPLKPLVFQKRQDYVFQSFNKPTDEHVFKRKEFLHGVDARGAFGYGLWQLAYGSLNTLNSANVEAYAAKMIALKGDEGHSLNVMPNLCVVGPSNWASARALFLVPTLSGGAANPNYGMCEVLVSSYLT